MTAPDRRGTRNPKTRQSLLDVTERLMLDEGYAAVGVRRVAREAGVTPALVLYYFPTLDDLFIAILRRRTETELARQAEMEASPFPLTDLWEVNSHPDTALLGEFLGLANHRPAFRAELIAHAERDRLARLDALKQRVAEGNLDIGDAPPIAIVVLTAAIARALVNEKGLGLTVGHEETMAFVRSLLAQYDGPPQSRREHGGPGAGTTNAEAGSGEGPG
ncbi:TetR/AcrR family transcriptional regulator [Yinghuangia sp. ASG 101]|uniref:TetR/AcrR family transcriptional regulator n=1 Tax=Yinghuangia sp. ASG 101 TaxID=2896848 RepID=UPI001E4D838C|nr:TetR/AcrR family transcriptional regulator [Yinghuangia sp. ASG 101]UGQ12483.1 TetR/AcrR family transcriptional regulator [Yinghuangia sp. ASG 101]